MATFVLSRERPILARSRSVLGSTCRRSIDPEDVFMEVAARLDNRVRRRAVHARSEGQLGSLVWTTLNSTLVDAIRRALRQQRCETAACLDAHRPRAAVAPAVPSNIGDTVWQVSRLIDNDRDQILFFLLARGVPFVHIAPVIGSSPAATRVRWGRLRRRLGAELERSEEFSRSAVALER